MHLPDFAYKGYLMDGGGRHLGWLPLRDSGEAARFWFDHLDYVGRVLVTARGDLAHLDSAGGGEADGATALAALGGVRPPAPDLPNPTDTVAAEAYLRAAIAALGALVAARRLESPDLQQGQTVLDPVAYDHPIHGLQRRISAVALRFGLNPCELGLAVDLGQQDRAP